MKTKNFYLELFVNALQGSEVLQIDRSRNSLVVRYDLSQVWKETEEKTEVVYKTMELKRDMSKVG